MKLCGMLVTLLLVGCASSMSPPAPAKRAPPAPPARPDTAAGTAAKAVDAIIYSNATKEEQLARLKPYAALMDTIQEVRAKSPLEAHCLGSGPGVLHCSIDYSGLRLVFDPDAKLRVIRRAARTIDGTVFPEMSLSQPEFEWNGYRRWYEN